MSKTSKKVLWSGTTAVLVVLGALIAVIVFQHFVYGRSDPDYNAITQLNRVVEFLRS